MPGELVNHPLWWTGPGWLKECESKWPTQPVPETEEEQRTVNCNLATIERKEFLMGNSTWFHLVRVLAYCLRMKEKRSIGGRLTSAEIVNIQERLIRQCQNEAFPEEMAMLTKKNELPARSKLLALNPFVDENGLLRVGGRLHNAMISYQNKHPIILPPNSEVTNRIITQMHADTLHGGPQLMLALLRKKYWIINGKRAVNQVFKSCVNCKRFEAKTIQQMMGDLPKGRVTLERAFLHTGVDYAGPIEVRSSKLRGSRLQKGYIAVFVCLGTRATHLELVSDCSTPAFLAAFNRFISRRGLCDTMYSDNGTNFVGAYNQLAKQEKQWLHDKNMELANLVSTKGINWSFIPPGAPNFGGLWERNVRSVKDHLKRTLKTTRLTFEEYATILCQIESCLNSRPLQPLTADVENINALTPGHFLIGDALMAPPQLSLMDNNANRLNRWKHLQLIYQHFWNRWSREYLNQLQQRKKWKQGSKEVHIGELVLVKDEQLPPKLWLLGRITETHPGSDGRVRVVTLLTHKGELKRPLNKICSLLNNDESEEGDEPIGKSVIESNESQHEVEQHDLGPDVKGYDSEVPIEKVKLIKPTGNIVAAKYNLRPRTSKMLMVTVVLGLMLIIGGGSAREHGMIQVHEFGHNAGIYFEELGRAQTIRTDWHLYVRFDLMRYRQDVKRLKEIAIKLSSLCMEMDSISSKGTCEDTTGLINHNMAHIDELNNMLIFNGDEPRMNNLLRKRRAAMIGALGWIQHELFGVMANEQAEEIENHFKLVETDNQHTLNLLKNQTSIIDSTINLMKSTQGEINKNYEKIEGQIGTLANETNIVKKKMKVLALTLYTLAFVERLGKTQDNILDMLTDLHQGHVSSHVFTPQQFMEQLEIMKNNLPTGSAVPEIAQHDIKALYKIIKRSARVTGRNILLEIIFPLVSHMDFQLFHIVTIPTKHQGKQITIVPDSEYLMINLKRDNFYQISREDVHTCLRPRENLFICEMRHLLYTSRSAESRCERELLNNQSELSPSCKIILAPEKEFWIRLSKKNTWIYGLKKSTTFNMVCGASTEPIILENSGLLELQPGCELNQQGMTIIAESVKQTSGDFNHYPLINLSEAVIRSDPLHNGNGVKMINLTLDHTSQLNDLSNQLQELNQQSNSQFVHHISHYGTQGGTLLLIGAIIFALWFNRVKILSITKQWLAPIEEKITDHNGGIVDDDVDDKSTQHGVSKTHHNSDDNLTNRQDNAAMQHEAGRCPFRT